jgi:hypothetical protein
MLLINSSLDKEYIFDRFVSGGRMHKVEKLSISYFF